MKNRILFLFTLLALITLCVEFSIAQRSGTTYRCTETWQGASVSRDCTSQSKSTCEKCINTGSGCKVSCNKKAVKEIAPE
jgi:hypothetical protein